MNEYLPADRQDVGGEPLEDDDEELSACCGWPIRQSCCGRCGEGA